MCGQYLSVYQIWRTISSLMTEIWPKQNFKMADSAILNFVKSGISSHMATLVWPISISVPSLRKISSFTTQICPNGPCMANVYLQSKFGANWSGNCWDTPVYVFIRWRLSAVLDLFYPNFGPPTMFPLMG